MARKATIPRYRKHTRGYAFVRLNGKDIYLGEHGTKRSKAEYDRIVTEWLASGRTLPQQEAPSLTVVELLVKYMRHARTYYGGTPEWRILKAVKIARKLYGRTPAADFGPLAFKSCRQVLIDEGVCRATVNSTIGKLKLIYKWATAEELVPPDVWHRLQAVSGLSKGRSAAKDHDPIAPGTRRGRRGHPALLAASCSSDGPPATALGDAPRRVVRAQAGRHRPDWGSLVR